MTPPPDRHQAERLLERIRTRVAELRGLEQTHTDQNELQQRQRDITRLRWQLARLIRKRSAVATSPPNHLAIDHPRIRPDVALCWQRSMEHLRG
jgi:hypothetical protein